MELVVLRVFHVCLVTGIVSNNPKILFGGTNHSAIDRIKNAPYKLSSFHCGKSIVPTFTIVFLVIFYLRLLNLVFNVHSCMNVY